MADFDEWVPTRSEARLARALLSRIDQVVGDAAARHDELRETVDVMGGDLRLLGRRLGSLAIKTSVVGRRQLALSRRFEVAVSPAKPGRSKGAGMSQKAEERGFGDSDEWIAHVDDRQDEMECRLDAADEALERMEAQHVGFNGRFDTIDRRLIRLTTWAERMDDKFDQFTDRRLDGIDAWRHDIDVWRDDVDRWRGEIDAWRADVDKRFDRIDAWRRDVDVWRVNVGTKLDKILVAVGAGTDG